FKVTTRTIRRWRANLIARGLLAQVSRRGHRGKFPEFELTRLGWQSLSNISTKRIAKSNANRKECPPKMSSISPSGSLDVNTDQPAVVDGQGQRPFSRP